MYAGIDISINNSVRFMIGAKFQFQHVRDPVQLSDIRPSQSGPRALFTLQDKYCWMGVNKTLHRIKKRLEWSTMQHKFKFE